MRVLLISGSYPPEFCGIGDYTSKLSSNLMLAGTDVHVLANINWSVKNIIKIIKQIKAVKPNLIHIQYPSAGYGYSITPQIISLLFKTVVTIHEVSQGFWVRKLSLMPFSFRSTLIFTNLFELQSFKKLFPWTRKDCHIIPIGSNISVEKIVPIEKKDTSSIIYFGQIRPQKGMEDVLKLAQIVKAENLPYKIIIVGQLFERFKDYYNSVLNSIQDLEIEWRLNLSEMEVGEILSSNMISYLPYPDGASARRGSLFAALQNKMLVFTTNGSQTTPDIKRSVVITSSPEEVCGLLKDNLNLPDMLQSKEKDIDSLIKSISWPEIVRQHNVLYRNEANNVLEV